MDDASAQLEVVILIGLQGAGKSTFFRERFAATHAHISKDRFPSARDNDRRQRELIAKALAAGQSVVVDNTNVRKVDRTELIAQARSFGARVVAYWLDTPLEDALRRNEERVGKAKVPIVGIMATRKRFEPPTEDEGFDELHRI